MSDKEWLNKVHLAFEQYEKISGKQSETYAFVLWLYKQYGIIPPERK